MKLNELKGKVDSRLYNALKKENIQELRPVQEKAIKSGLLQGENLLVCTPTASGKTLVAEIAMINQILTKGGMALYIAPLKALVTEKFKQMVKKYGDFINIALSTGDLEFNSPNLRDYDLILCTQEKLDSLLRHRVPWINNVKVVVFDEIHVINDESRGPTLEIIITILKQMLSEIQLIGLSATIGNPRELASWLNAKLIFDDWRPVKLEKGIFYNDEIYFYKDLF